MRTLANEAIIAKDQFLSLFYDDAFEEDADKIERCFTDFAYLTRCGEQ
jgi:hypothetical protein